MNILPCSQELSLATSFRFDDLFATALCAVIYAVAAEPTDSTADLLDEIDCAVTRLTLATLGRQA